MAIGRGGSATTAGTLPNFLQPTQGKSLYAGNYLNFTNGSIDQWAQQFLPDVYDKEIEIYGNRTISGFLKMVSAEMPSTSDQIIWLEQGRLHTRYEGVALQQNSSGLLGGTGSTLGTAALTAGTHIRATVAFDATNNNRPEAFTSTTEQSQRVNFRVGQTVMVGLASGGTIKGIISDAPASTASTNTNAFVFSLYQGFTPVTGDNAGATALVYGSEFAKGTGNFTEKLDPSYSTYSNAPIIMKEHYSINGSDTGQIGWIEVTSENGASGYLWYVKAEHENRLRWEDYIEMSMVEGVTQATGAGITPAQLRSYRGDFGAGGTTTSGQSARGTEGLFQALENRGNVYVDLTGDLGGTTGGDSDPDTSGTQAYLTGGLDAFDAILRQLDRQGSIEENMLYVDRGLALAFDDMLSNVNTAGNATGTSWGVFNNSKDMALNLGFNGFRRGSYDFYKTDWKYLNDYSTRGGFNDIQGVMIPAGTSTVYDQNLGKNIKRPFLHVRYRASETDNRKMKSWITGSVGGAYTTDVDEMRMHYLTERCLITQGANNFFLLTD